MSFKQLISQRLKGEPGSELAVNRGVNSGVNFSGQKFTQKVARIEQNCQGCQYRDTGPTPDGKGTIQWCGPFGHANGDLHYFNIAEWSICPLDVKRQMQGETGSLINNREVTL
jgi:hypothetical protein